jgi:3-oxoacyl-[acyl-carrier protein] reductase
MGLLDNKTAIVTGSSRGIGAEVAKILAGEGAAVVVNYRQKAPRANKVVRGSRPQADVQRLSALT